MSDPKLPDTLWILFYHQMGEGWRRRFFIQEDKALEAWRGYHDSRLYVAAPLDDRWKEID